MKICGALRVTHRVGRYVASAVRRRAQLNTVCNPQSSAYRSGKVVLTNRATSLDANIENIRAWANFKTKMYKNVHEWNNFPCALAHVVIRCNTNGLDIV